MNRSIIGIVLGAFILSLAISVVVYKMVKRQMNGGGAISTSVIVVAAKNLEVGTILKKEDLKEAKWPGDVPPGLATAADKLVGRGVISPLYGGEPIMEARLAAPGSGGGLASIIPRGKRACAVRVDDVVGVAGFVIPGMRVDVLISGTLPGNSDATGSQSRTLLQNIEVLSAGENIQKDVEGKPATVRVVNLLVSPEEAEKLSLASNQAKLQLVLRNPLDTEIAKTPGTAMSTLFGSAAPPPVEKEKAQPVKPVRRPARPPAAQNAPKPVERPVHSMELLTGAKRAVTKMSIEGEQ